MAPPDDDLECLRQVALQSARRILTYSDRLQSEDVAQEALEQYLDYARTHEVGNPGGLVRVIARRLAYKERKSWVKRYDDAVIGLVDDEEDEARSVEFGDRAMAKEHVEPAAAGADPVQRLVESDRRQELEWALAQLTDRDRQIAELTYLHDPPRTAPQVADALGLADGTVRNRLVVIRTTLRTLLEDDDGTGDGEG